GRDRFWMVVRRVRKRKEAKREAEAARLQAVVNVLPEKLARSVSEAFEDGRWKPWALAAGGVWLVLRLAELRQLRRMNLIVGACPGRHAGHPTSPDMRGGIKAIPSTGPYPT